MNSPSRNGVLVLTHSDSDTKYVEATGDLTALESETRSNLQLGRHECEPLQQAYNRDNRIVIEVFPTPSHVAAKQLEVNKKRQLITAGALINDGSHNPAALFSYH
jgi:hypothetical protein